MSITREDVEALAPEFTVTPDTVMDCYIEIACSLVKHPGWGGKGNKAKALLTAHFLTLQGASVGGGAGPVIEKRVGSVQVKYGGSTFGSESLSDTFYGRTFLLCMRSNVAFRLPFTTC